MRVRSLLAVTKKTGTKAGPSPVKLTDDGLHLMDSILWLDAYASGELSFLSSALANPQSPRVRQLIATEETVRLLAPERRRAGALVCQYNRPFSIGRLRMELLPSGDVLGGASLFVESDQGKLLYAPKLQPHRIPTVRQMQLKRAHTMILGLPPTEPDSVLPNRRREKERLLETISRLVRDDAHPIIFCEPIGTAQEIMHMLNEVGIPVCVHDAIYKASKIYESFGAKLGDYGRVSKRRIKERVTMLPRLTRRGAGLPVNLPDQPLILVENSATNALSPPASRVPVEVFNLSMGCDSHDIKDLVTLAAPKELYVFGPYTKAYVELLTGTCPVVAPLYANDQPTLF